MAENKRLKQHSPGRPRSAASETAILNATVDLLEESGYEALTIEAIAQRAGVGKSTIYRWWPNKASVVFDAFLTSTETSLYFLEHSTFRDNFRQQLQSLATILNSALGRTVVGLVAGSGEDSEIAVAFHKEFLKSRREDAIRVIERAIVEAEIQYTTNMEIIADMFYGPIYYRLLIQKKVVDSTFIDTLLDQVMKSICRD
ncbi:TetR/AcrR family transcriptional regulator [Bacillus tuaregi]|uniref:TetR/AcrR family transcriptional regulator n=1 Tax=Bacillus tuaregi TaxID=1816695 RepID=UPI0008F8ADFA|nr:TetR/AcrR family transcriptional regulator [Bacillus tuaregi]